jgi:hypothetical protein
VLDWEEFFFTGKDVGDIGCWMTTDLVIRTYSGDFDWLNHCLESCKKRAKGFANIKLLVDDRDASLFGYDFPYDVHSTGPTWSDGYIQQMCDKLYADLYSNADYIVHTDSDCVFIRDISPEDLMEDGKPVWLMHPFGSDPNPWPPIVHKALGFSSPLSFMRRHPFMIPRGIYARFRAWMAERHGTSLANYIKSQPYREFIEYESLGCWCYEFARDEFVWKEQDEFPVFVKQYWSWGGLDEEKREEIKKILAD